MSSIDLNPQYLATVKTILKKYLPSNARTWIFGSRARGNAKKYSDIDILIDTGSLIPIETMAQLNLAFEESTLPYKVDLVDAASIDKSFHDKIQAELLYI